MRGTGGREIGFYKGVNTDRSKPKTTHLPLNSSTPIPSDHLDASPKSNLNFCFSMASKACNTCNSYLTCVCAENAARQEEQEASRQRAADAAEDRQYAIEEKQLRNEALRIDNEQRQLDIDERKKNAG